MASHTLVGRHSNRLANVREARASRTSSDSVRRSQRLKPAFMAFGATLGQVGEGRRWYAAGNATEDLVEPIWPYKRGASGLVGAVCRKPSKRGAGSTPTLSANNFPGFADKRLVLKLARRAQTVNSGGLALTAPRLFLACPWRVRPPGRRHRANPPEQSCGLPSSRSLAGIQCLSTAARHRRCRASITGRDAP